MFSRLRIRTVLSPPVWALRKNFDNIVEAGQLKETNFVHCEEENRDGTLPNEKRSTRVCDEQEFVLHVVWGMLSPRTLGHCVSCFGLSFSVVNGCAL